MCEEKAKGAGGKRGIQGGEINQKKAPGKITAEG